MVDIYYEIKNLVDYAVRKRLIEEADRIYATNAVLEVLEEDNYIESSKESTSSTNSAFSSYQKTSFRVSPVNS